MNRSILAITLALGLSAGFAGAASAADQTPASPNLATQSALLPSQVVENAALDAYNANINPNVTVSTTGIYDVEDRYTGPTGTPLPGWGALKGEGLGDNGG